MRRAAVLVGVVGLSLGGILISPDAASAATFEITTPDGALFTTSSVTIEGTKDTASVIDIPSLTGGDPYCQVPGVGQAPTESWSCTFTLADGAWPVAVNETIGGVTSSAVVNVRVLGAPTIDGADPLLTTGLLTGTGFAGAGIRIIGSGPQDPSGDCTTVQSDGAWTCPLPVTESGDYSIAVQQIWQGVAGGSSAPRTVTVDTVPPPLPTVTSPASGDRITTSTLTFAGTGENGARVDVFVDSTLACSVFVTGAEWSCAVNGIPAGEHRIQAIQWDAAGNPSGATTGIPVTVAAPEVAAPAPAPPAAPQAPAPPNAAPPAPSSPLFPPPVGGNSGLPPGDTWGTPTGYGAAIPSVTTAATTGLWWWGLLIASGFILAVALPARLLISALRGRIVWRRHQIAGRNQAKAEPDDEPLLRPWVTAAIALAIAVALATLAGGVQSEVRYLRLVLAITIALVVLGGLGVVLPAKLAGRLLRYPTGIRLVPGLLAVGAVTALISRAGGIQPPLVIGVVLAVTMAPGMPRRERGLVTLAQLAAVTLLGFAAWLGHSALGPVDGFGPSLASEALGSLCIAALGSAALLVLPIGRMPGRVVFEWSRPAWLAVALATCTLAAVAIAQAPTFPVAWAIGVAVAFAAGSLGTWAWVRLVEPSLAAGAQ